MPNVFLSEIILIIIAAFFGGFTARSLKLPPILGYIVSGIIFGIIGKNFFQSYESLLALSEIGIALLLFTLGFEISLDIVRNLNKKILLVGVFQVIFTTLGMLPLLLLFSLDAKFALLLSMLFSFSSTAVVVKLLEEKGLLNDFPGNNVFIFLIIQDLFVVPIIFFLPILFSKAGVSPASFIQFLISAIKPIGIFIGILLLSKLFLSRLLNFLFRYPSHELTILATIFTATVSILLFSLVGLPKSIAAFLAGVLISEQGKNLAPLTEIRPFRDLFLVLFFVLTGMLLNFDYFLNNIALVVGLSAAVIFTKFLISYLILRFSSYSEDAGIFISSYLSNIGEFAPVIGQIAFTAAIIGAEEYNLILSVFILSLFSIPFLLRWGRAGVGAIIRRGILGKVLPKEEALAENLNRTFENHVVICGHGRVGRETCAMLGLSNIPYVVIDFNKKVIDDLLSLSKYAIYGDPTDIDILKASFIENARILVIAVPDTFSQKRIVDSALKLNPKIIILCRSHIEEDRYDLINMGVNTIIMPELEAGLRIGSEILDLFGVKQEEIDAYVKRLRRQHLL